MTNWQDALVSKTKLLLLYPTIVFIVVTAVVFFPHAVFGAEVGDLLTTMQQTLPLQTRLLIWLSEIFGNYWALLLGLPLTLFVIGVTAVRANANARLLWVTREPTCHPLPRRSPGPAPYWRRPLPVRQRGCLVPCHERQSACPRPSNDGNIDPSAGRRHAKWFATRLAIARSTAEASAFLRAFEAVLTIRTPDAGPFDLLVAHGNRSRTPEPAESARWNSILNCRSPFLHTLNVQGG